MTTTVGELTLIHGADTIYHPSVQMWYDVATEQLVALRTKNRNVSSFKSSYFGMELNVDLLKWNLAKDSITFDILNGKKEIPMSVESDQYFTMDRYTRMNPIFPIHPLVMVVKYARKYGIKEFYDQELAKEYTTSIEIVRAEIKILESYGLIKYDTRLGEVKVLEKAFHYYDAGAKKSDYDYLFMHSYSPYKPNGLMLLDSGQLIVNGVKKEL